MKDITGVEIQYGDTVALARRGHSRVWLVLMRVVGIDNDRPILHECDIGSKTAYPTGLPITQLLIYGDNHKAYVFKGNSGALFIVTRTKEIKSLYE